MIPRSLSALLPIFAILLLAAMPASLPAQDPEPAPAAPDAVDAPDAVTPADAPRGTGRA